MNRRADDRIEMRLPCQLLFPRLWGVPVEGLTTNLHRNGILIACSLTSAKHNLPVLGEQASVRIVLPENHSFGRKCIECDATLIRILQITPCEWQFAVRIHNVSFGDWLGMSENDTPRYVI